jgi:nitroimidazol reductase NimA-like FMN-containing flavoprotein (pyridoxamine 5'-phosphate oxidase superfamily)
VLDMPLAEIEQMLRDARIGRLAMAAGDGRPYVIPLPFCWLDDALYLRLPLTGRKGAILTSNSHVCFEIDEFTDDLQEYASVLVEGRLVPVADQQEKVRVKRINDEKYRRLRGGYRPGHGRTTPIETLPLQKILVACISGRRKDPSQAPRRPLADVTPDRGSARYAPSDI